MARIDISDTRGALGSGLEPASGLVLVTLGAVALLGYAVVPASALREHGTPDAATRADLPVRETP